MRNNLSQNQIVGDASSYYKLLLDTRLQIEMVIPVSENVVRVVYRAKKDFVKEHSTSNIVISLWTTSVARLVLYDYMRRVDDAIGCRVLYTDTVCSLCKEQKWKIHSGLYYLLSPAREESSKTRSISWGDDYGI